MIIDDEGNWLDEPIPEPGKARKQKSDGTQHHKFKGIYIYAEVWELYWAAKLTPREFLLVATIDSLCDRHSGCYASNAWLAKRVRATATHVAHMIGTLKGLGLVRQVFFDGRKRILETKWSRVEGRGRKSRKQVDAN